MRNRIAATAARVVPSGTLWARTHSALDVVARSKSLSEVLRACNALEVSTRLSPVCCAMFASKGIVSTILALITSCNRSKPHIELVR